MNWIQHGLILMVRLYRLIVSPALATFAGPLGRCRFEPSCSRYAMEAIQKRGAIVGTGLAVHRLCRCHPWGGEGADPVPEASLFATRLFCKVNHHAESSGTGAKEQVFFHG